jgi:hypothetical protein
VGKNVTARQTTDHNIIGRMSLAYCVSKGTNIDNCNNNNCFYNAIVVA